ncbi:MAG: NAD(P)H-dependent oxidoreductase subunit E [Opitutaceae bacterium]
MSGGTELGDLLDWVKGMRGTVRELVREWEGREGNLIMILHAIQGKFGYIPRGAANELAMELGIHMARIYEVITFYNYFRLTPPGRHTIQVCMGTACYLKGAMGLHDVLARQLKLLDASGGREGEFELETVRCIGCCGMAPAVVVDGETHGRLCPNAVAKILKEKRGG